MSTTDTPAERSASRVCLVDLVPLLVVLPLLAFLNRAVMIDDTLFLKAAGHILRDPFRPYDMTVNWYGREDAFWDVFKNPPGLAYWLAGVQALVGSGERALHASMLAFTIAAALASGQLARRFVPRLPWATTMWLASPAFLVSAATLMADVPALALSLWGLVLWIKGVDGGSSKNRRLGALIAGAAVVVKYTAVLGIATLVLYTICADRNPDRAGGPHGPDGRWFPGWKDLLDLWPALLPLAVWTVMTLATVGRVHMLDSLIVPEGGLDPKRGWLLHRPIAIATFVAASGIFPLLMVPRGIRVPLVAPLAVMAGVIAIFSMPVLWPKTSVVVPVGAITALGAVALGGAICRRSDRDSTFLSAWTALYVVYLFLWSWTIAVRFVLPIMVPLALIAARAFANRPHARGAAVFLGMATAVTGLFGILVLAADSATGAFHRRIVPVIVAAADDPQHHRVVFFGSWGFQYYAEQRGLRALDLTNPNLNAGDRILDAEHVARSSLPTALLLRLSMVRSADGPVPILGIQTMNPHLGAGLHSTVYGPLPYSVGVEPVDTVVLWTIRP